MRVQRRVGPVVIGRPVAAAGGSCLRNHHQLLEQATTPLHIILGGRINAYAPVQRFSCQIPSSGSRWSPAFRHVFRWAPPFTVGNLSLPFLRRTEALVFPVRFSGTLNATMNAHYHCFVLTSGNLFLNSRLSLSLLSFWSATAALGEAYDVFMVAVGGGDGWRVGLGLCRLLVSCKRDEGRAGVSNPLNLPSSGNWQFSP